MQFLKNATTKAKDWLRERKEQAEARKALRSAAASEHMHGRFFLLHVPAMATICAAITEWYWAILFCIEATGGIDWNYETSFGTAVASEAVWNFAFSTHWPVFLGLVCATVPIVMLSMVWLPVQFAMRGSGRWRRGSVITVGVLANILVIVSGTVVMNHNRQDQVRDAVVIEQTAAQGRAAIDARLAFEQEQLRLALNNSNPYLNQAANVGAEEWERSYVAQARATNDPRLPQLERALGAARAADQRRANIERLTIERATAAPEAASAANVEDRVGAELNTFAQYVEVWRPPFIAVICTLIGIFGAWWVLALIQGMNPRDVLRSGWADEAHRIEDKRAEEPIVPQPMKPAREVVTDAETGEELVKVTPRPHWRKRKGKVQKHDIQPDIPPDEKGVSYDGGERSAVVTIGGLMEVANGGRLDADVPPKRNETKDEGPEKQQGDGLHQQLKQGGVIDEKPAETNDSANERADNDGGNQPIDDEVAQDDLPSEQDLAEALEVLEPTLAPEDVHESGEGPEHHAADEAQEAEEQKQTHDDTPEREPETREDRLIAPVAAE